MMLLARKFRRAYRKIFESRQAINSKSLGTISAYRSRT